MSDPDYPRIIYIRQQEPAGDLDVGTEGWAFWEALAALDEAENQITAREVEAAETEEAEGDAGDTA